MNCEETGQFLKEARNRPSENMPADVLAHLLTCGNCRERADAGETTADEQISSGARQRITAQVMGFLTPVTPIPSQSRLILRAVAVIVGVPSLVLTVIGDGGTHVMTLLQLVAWLIVIGAAEIILSVSLAGLIVPGSRHRLNAHLLLILCVTSYACAALLIFRSSPGAFEPHTGARCFAVGCATAAVAGILLVYVTRKGVVLSWPQTGASTGLLAGMVGASVLLFHCKTAEMIHVVVWHTGVLLFCTLMGAVAGMGPAIFARNKAA